MDTVHIVIASHGTHIMTEYASYDAEKSERALATLQAHGASDLFYEILTVSVSDEEYTIPSDAPAKKLCDVCEAAGNTDCTGPEIPVVQNRQVTKLCLAEYEKHMQAQV